ncbi:degV family protein [Syntrophobotulus glycolicus DSM 8271]|uniref:DegV family protein n=1 Tax=Syntrophobotulus glycolicus (strain DSM 8271 / FlGlyR) TaxID=645991 RepID=F0SUI8_SYNGF|nr:DegV family protein [Syntrophobotulus glycolicus]ADY55481.1 degV family protein [Syntrophobotulus glycolicus DSM 8271]
MNKTICQIVDSSGSLPRDLIKEYNISEVPFYFKFDNPEYYCENVDYGRADFYQHMREYPEKIPQTSAPNVYDWLKVFEQQYARGLREFIVTTISEKLSASFQTALLAKEMFEKEKDDVRMEVISSNTCACGQAALEIGIAKMIDHHRGFGEIVRTIQKLVTNISTLFVVDSLTYMKAGGRIGGAAAFLGKLINLKPICEFVDGAVRPIKTVRGRNHSLKTMIDIAVSRFVDINQTLIIIQNADCAEDAEDMVNYLREKTNDPGQIFQSDLGITVGAHSGPGAIGIGFVENPVV